MCVFLAVSAIIVLVSDQARNVLAEALRLPVSDRADVAAELLRSLDQEESQLPAAEVERLWAEEITRRAQRAIRGESIGTDADVVLASIEAKLARR
jgi:hypothetical protein